ncbi:hypothetical protein D3C85_1508800 [compost metagenome]
MKIRVVICIAIIFLFSINNYSQVSSVKLSSYKKGNYDVSTYQSDMGGGGYITGIVQDFENSDILYGRSDVAGVFKSVNGGKSWNLSNAGLNLHISIPQLR